MEKLIEICGMNGALVTLVFAGMVIGFIIGINVSDKIGKKKD